MGAHVHDWHELGRVFPFEEAAFDVDNLSPDGGHVEVEGKDGSTFELVAASHPGLEGKVPAPTPHIILQCQDPDCPDGPKHIEHVELKKAEWEKIKAAYEGGRLDPDGDGTNRYLSQLSLEDLGLARIQAQLGEGRRSGVREQVIV